MSHGHAHSHRHGLIDPSIKRSREGLRVVVISLALLAVTAIAQVAIYIATDSVALLADLVHNAGDALTAIAALVRLNGGRRLDSPALLADGQHARSDALVSGGVILSAIAVALHAPIVDPIIGLVITALILRITWESANTVRARGHAHPKTRQPRKG